MREVEVPVILFYNSRSNQIITNYLVNNSVFACDACKYHLKVFDGHSRDQTYIPIFGMRVTIELMTNCHTTGSLWDSSVTD